MKKKYLLSVQGEGRGHVTQAMTLYELLVANGHEVCAIILGSSGKRDIPTFFIDKVKAPIIQLQSPNFVTDKKNKSINVTKSVIHGFKNLKTYRQSLKKIDEIVKKEKPDVIINFFDLLVGLYYRFYKPNIPHLCIAHQYIYLHPHFEFPKGKKLPPLVQKRNWHYRFMTFLKKEIMLLLFRHCCVTTCLL
jgi:UDP-N-acetylglucosamine:LPS N-acetylglucosamine transferase